VICHAGNIRRAALRFNGIAVVAIAGSRRISNSTIYDFSAAEEASKHRSEKITHYSARCAVPGSAAAISEAIFSTRSRST
jgi:hypothetical protein